MNFNEYVIGALRTESAQCPLGNDTVSLGLTNRIAHAVIGLNTEVSEIVEAYTKNDYFHIDYVNVAEELGDMYWYLAILFDEFEADATNIELPTDEISMGELPLVLSVMVGDMLDKVKKTMFYGKKYDVLQLNSDMLDLYMTLYKCVNGLKRYLSNVTVEKIWSINLHKLMVRYPDKFEFDNADIRDLQKERIILEKINNAN